MSGSRPMMVAELAVAGMVRFFFMLFICQAEVVAEVSLARYWRR